MRTFASISMLLVITRALLGCETETPTTAVVDDGYPAIPDGGDLAKQVTVFKAWWVTTVFLDPVTPGAESGVQRTVPATDFAYAILAPGWDPTGTAPPTTLIPMKSSTTLTVNRGDTLRIAVSDDTFAGNCAAGKPLSQADADFITKSIFPGDFAAVTYDAKTCTATPVPGDGGVNDAGSEGGGGER